MTDVEAELRELFIEVFEEASYPIENQMELVPALPNGPSTRFEVGDFSMTAMELAMELNAYQEFPYASAEEMVEDIMTGLREEGFI